VRHPLHPITRETERKTGELVREFEVRSAATVVGAFIGVLFLLFFLAAFIPWLLARGMTAAVEGLMQQIGFGDFDIETLGDWILVLFVGAVFTSFIVMMVVSILALYNVISQRTGMGMRVQPELPATPAPPALTEVVTVREVEGAGDHRTFDELYTEAQRRGIRGRSSMSKAELVAALEAEPKGGRARARRI
jgi:hypothetical protein